MCSNKDPMQPKINNFLKKDGSVPYAEVPKMELALVPNTLTPKLMI